MTKEAIIFRKAKFAELKVEVDRNANKWDSLGKLTLVSCKIGGEYWSSACPKITEFYKQRAKQIYYKTRGLQVKINRILMRIKSPYEINELQEIISKKMIKER